MSDRVVSTPRNPKKSKQCQLGVIDRVVKIYTAKPQKVEAMSARRDELVSNKYFIGVGFHKKLSLYKFFFVNIDLQKKYL